MVLVLIFDAISLKISKLGPRDAGGILEEF